MPGTFLEKKESIGVKMILSHIVAASENNVIGRDNDLPWNIPEDLKFFKDKTLNSILIMGRKTYDSIGRPLPKRTTIVVSRSAKPKDFPESIFLCSNLQQAIAKASELSEQQKIQEVFIVGGGEIYKQTLNLADKVYLTRIHTEVDGHAYYPEIKNSEFNLVSEKKSETKDYKYSFLEYSKNKF